MFDATASYLFDAAEPLFDADTTPDKAREIWADNIRITTSDGWNSAAALVYDEAFRIALSKASYVSIPQCKAILKRLVSLGIDLNEHYCGECFGHLIRRTFVHDAVLYGAPEFVAVILGMGGNPHLLESWVHGEKPDADAFDLLSHGSSLEAAAINGILASWRARRQAAALLDEGSEDGGDDELGDFSVFNENVVA